MDCQYCGEPITTQSMPMPHYDGKQFYMHEYHYECYMRMIVGGLNHLKKTCKCAGGSDTPDPPEMTKRQAALAAFDYWWEKSKIR